MSNKTQLTITRVVLVPTSTICSIVIIRSTRCHHRRRRISSFAAAASSSSSSNDILEVAEPETRVQVRHVERVHRASVVGASGADAAVAAGATQRERNHSVHVDEHDGNSDSCRRSSRSNLLTRVVKVENQLLNHTSKQTSKQPLFVLLFKKTAAHLN